MKRTFFIFLFFSLTIMINAQNHFDYLQYVDETVRDGTLLYDDKKNEAIYIDRSETMRNIRDVDYGGALLVSVNSGENDYFFKNESKELQYTGILLKIPYLILDKIGEIEWQFVNETKEIQGYKCHKAFTEFRGRKWEVWYSPEIPVQYGPWKFANLPGLLFEATDESKRFGFQLTAIKTSDELENLTVNLKDYRKVDMKTYDQQLADALNFKSLSNSRYYTIEGEPFKRQGIELIYEWEENND